MEIPQEPERISAESKLRIELHRDQREIWPKAGRHVLAHFDEESVINLWSEDLTLGCGLSSIHSFDRSICSRTSEVWRGGLQYNPNDLGQDKLSLDDVQVSKIVDALLILQMWMGNQT